MSFMNTPGFENSTNPNKPQQQRKFSVLSLIAFLVSLVAVFLYAEALNGRSTALWAIMSVVSIILPIVAKAVRIHNHLSGRGLDIAAFVIGVFALYFLLFAATKIAMLIIFIIIAIFCAIYISIKE